MAYPGNSELSSRAQERVMSAFRLVIGNLQDGRKEEALVGLDFVLRLDPSFSPALVLQEQLSTGEGVVKLQDILAQIDAPATEEINLLLVEAIEDFEQRHLIDAQEKVRRVLLDLPGHEEARNLSRQIEETLEKEAQVGHFLIQAREALDSGDPQEASNFVMMAQALDPHHPGIHDALEVIQERGQALMEPSAGVSNAEAPVSPEVAMPHSFDLDEPDREALEDKPGPPVEVVQGEFQQGSEFESSGVGDLFEDIGAPPEQPESAIGDLFDDIGAPPGEVLSPAEDLSEKDQQPPVESPIGLDPDVAAGYAAGADDWKIRSSEGEAQPATGSAEPSPEVEQAREEPSWAPEFDNFGDDVSDLFSTDSVDGLSVDSGPESVQHSPEAQEADLGLKEESPEAPDPAAAIGASAVEEIPAEVLPPIPVEEPPYEAGEDQEEDLFSDDFSLSDELNSLEARSRETLPQPGVSRGVPLKIVGLVVLALVVLAGGMWLGMRLMGSSDSDESRAQVVQELIQDADELLKQGKPEEALHLLENFKADDIEKARIQKHILKIREAMAPPTPTPPPEETGKARDLLAQGDWLGAFEEVQKGLAAHPQDPGLQDLKTQIAKSEDQAVPLFKAMEQKDDRSVASLGMELEKKYPNESRISELVDRSLFNGALQQLRSYNLTGARAMLVQLHSRRPDDAEVARILKFSEKYIKKPVDMQLEIFVGSIRPR